jgi:peptidoglycan/xylan/chitin deacetylase (PgdA/CDA1 family)
MSLLWLGARRRAVLGLLVLLAALALPTTASARIPADALADAYVDLGGRGSLGPILGPAFQRSDDAGLYLATTRAVLAQAPTGDVGLANAMAWFTEADKDGWLEVARGVPRPVGYASADLLTQPQIAAAYWADYQQIGLPTSWPQRFGPFVSQRFERGVLQLWVDAVPDAPEPGAVTSVLVGDLLAEAGLLPHPPRPRLPATVAPGDVLTRHTSADAVAITYDMGSIDVGLAGVLEALQVRGLRATFFVTGDFVRRYEWALPRIRELGHEVANHTVTHPDLTTLAGPRALREVDALDAALAVRGAPPSLWFRPPFGAYNGRVQGLLASRGYPLVMWRLDLADWRDEIGVGDVIRIGRGIRAGDVVVTHGGLPKTATAMPTVLDELAARGLRQVTLSDLYSGG